MTAPQLFRNILAPVALAGQDDELLRHAAFAGDILGPVRFHLVHVRRPQGPETLEQSQVALDKLVSQVTSSLSTPPTRKVYEGPLEDRLLTYAREYNIDLILMGHQRTHSRRRALGRRLAMHAPCSVWIVPEGSPVELRRILVPIDFSSNAADALQVAAALARRAGLKRVSALHVRFNEANVTYEEYNGIFRGEERRAMDEFLADIDAQELQVDYVFEEAAHVAVAVDRVAEREHVDLVVMSTRGRSRAAAVLLGSQTEQVIMETQRPVLVVKHHGAHLNLLDALLDPRFSKKGVRFG